MGYTVEEFLSGSSAKPVGIHFINSYAETTYLGTFEDFIKSEKRNHLVSGANWVMCTFNKQHHDLPDGFYLVCREC